MLRSIPLTRHALSMRRSGLLKNGLRVSSTTSQQERSSSTHLPVALSIAAVVAAFGLFTANEDNRICGNISCSQCEGATAPCTSAALPKKTGFLAPNGSDKFAFIVVGGGTAGCITAYLLAKWLENNGRSETVLLLDRGPPFTATEGPSPLMEAWFDNWGIFGEAHTAIRAADGSEYPAVPTTHNGVGGCGTHDTRVSFLMRPEQRNRVAAAMGWSSDRYSMYYQAALDMIPLLP